MRRWVSGLCLPFGDVRLARLLLAVFLFNFGAAAWSAVVAGHLVQSGEGPGSLGALYAACEVVRLPGALLLPLLTLRFGVRRVTEVGVLALGALPLLALFGMGNPQVVLMFVVSALPTMAVFVGLPAFVMGAMGSEHDGSALGWLGLVGGAGGALGPWFGGLLADSYGLGPALALYALGSLLLLPTVLWGHLPPPSEWAGWSVLAGRGLPWKALVALGLASAADAGRAALVPTALVRDGMSLADTGFLLAVAAALAGAGFIAFGRLADRHSPTRVLGAGLVVLVVGSFVGALLANDAFAYALSGAVLGMGASGIKLGADVALIAWIGRDRASVGVALGQATVIGGRFFGAPAVGVLGDSRGDGYAFSAIGLTGLIFAALLAVAVLRGSRRRTPAAPTEIVEGVPAAAGA